MSPVMMLGYASQASRSWFELKNRGPRCRAAPLLLCQAHAQGWSCVFFQEARATSSVVGSCEAVTKTIREEDHSGEFEPYVPPNAMSTSAAVRRQFLVEEDTAGYNAKKNKSMLGAPLRPEEVHAGSLCRAAVQPLGIAGDQYACPVQGVQDTQVTLRPLDRAFEHAGVPSQRCQHPPPSPTSLRPRA